MYSETPNRIKLAKCADINQTRPNMKILWQSFSVSRKNIYISAHACNICKIIYEGVVALNNKYTLRADVLLSILWSLISRFSFVPFLRNLLFYPFGSFPKSHIMMSFVCVCVPKNTKGISFLLRLLRYSRKLSRAKIAIFFFFPTLAIFRVRKRVSFSHRTLSKEICDFLIKENAIKGVRSLWSRKLWTPNVFPSILNNKMLFFIWKSHLLIYFN